MVDVTQTLYGHPAPDRYVRAMTESASGTAGLTHDNSRQPRVGPCHATHRRHKCSCQCMPAPRARCLAGEASPEAQATPRKRLLHRCGTPLQVHQRCPSQTMYYTTPSPINHTPMSAVPSLTQLRHKGLLHTCAASCYCCQLLLLLLPAVPAAAARQCTCTEGWTHMLTVSHW
jgi:hypothetical protein